MSRRRSLCDSNIYIDFFLGNKESPLVGLELEWSGAAWPGLAVDELCVDALLSVQAAVELVWRGYLLDGSQP